MQYDWFIIARKLCVKYQHARATQLKANFYYHRSIEHAKEEREEEEEEKKTIEENVKI